MVTITFPDVETEKRAVAFLSGLGEIGTAAATGGRIIPESALAPLAEQNITFIVLGNSTSANGAGQRNGTPNQVMLSALARVEEIQKGMSPTPAGNTVDYLREARAGGMYGNGSNN